MTVAKPTLQLQWIISTMIVLLTYGGGFVYDRGVKAQEAKDTAKAIEERTKVDEEIKQCIKENENKQIAVNEKLLTLMTTLQMTLVEIQTEIKLKRKE